MYICIEIITKSYFYSKTNINMTAKARFLMLQNSDSGFI